MTSVNYLHYSISCVPIYSLGNSFLLPGQTQCPYTANVIYPPRSCYCIFPVNTPLILKEEGKRQSDQTEALLNMSCTTDLLSALYIVANDDDTWLIYWWSTHGFYIHINVLTMCCAAAALVTKWVTDSSRWLKAAFEWFVELIRHLVVDQHKRL